jgi:hypothetical protein
MPRVTVEGEFLVPKLCLGTHAGKLCFPSCREKWAAKQSFASVRSQAELGNEERASRAR